MRFPLSRRLAENPARDARNWLALTTLNAGVRVRLPSETSGDEWRQQAGSAFGRRAAATGSGWRAAGERVGLVPTMGALHAGHLALAAVARAECQRVAVSIFVNLKQFGPREDFSSYPRPEADDLAKLAAARVDLAFIPAVEEIYSAGFATTISVGGPKRRALCGAHRAGTFLTGSRRWSPSC